MYDVTFAAQVAKRLRKLPKKEQERFLEAAFQLKQFPDKGDIKQLGGVFGYFRLRVGKWRYIFKVNRQDQLIKITKLDTRGDVYK